MDAINTNIKREPKKKSCVFTYPDFVECREEEAVTCDGPAGSVRSR
jgi:hypothetical protein